MWHARYGLWGVEYGTRVTGYGVWSMARALRAMGCEVWHARYRLYELACTRYPMRVLVLGHEYQLAWYMHLGVWGMLSVPRSVTD